MKQKGEDKKRSEQQIDIPFDWANAREYVGQFGVQLKKIVVDREFAFDGGRRKELVTHYVVSGEQNCEIDSIASLELAEHAGIWTV